MCGPSPERDQEPQPAQACAVRSLRKLAGRGEAATIGRVTAAGTLLRPRALAPGDLVAVLSPSAGLASRHPAVLDAAIAFLRDDLGLRVKELSSARAPGTVLRADPRRRADDLHEALRDPEVKGIVAACGGEDAARVLPYLAPQVFAEHPKLLLGSDDFTAVLAFAARLGLVAWHGPNAMEGLAQGRALGTGFRAQLQALLFGAPSHHEYRPFPAFHDGYPDWELPGDPAAPGPRREDPRGWRFLQGKGRVRGRLWGGCLEVVEHFLRGTPHMPAPGELQGRVLFLAPHAAASRPAQVRWALRGLGLSGALERVAALLLGRPRGWTLPEREELERDAVEVLAGEFGHRRLPIVANLGFGPTDPQLLLPLNGMLELDCEAGRMWLAEPAMLAP